MHVTDNKLYVKYENRLYRHSFPTNMASVNETSFLHFEPLQSQFRIDADKPTSQLMHRISGGMGPYEVFDDLSLDGGILMVEENTGTVTVNGPRLKQRAIDLLVDFGIGEGLAELRAASLRDIEPWSKLPEQQRPTGIPVALPIFLRAVDRKGETAILRYYVYTEVNFETVVPLLKKAIGGNDEAGANSTTTTNTTSTVTSSLYDLNHPDGVVIKRDGWIVLLIANLVVLILILLTLVCCLACKLRNVDALECKTLQTRNNNERWGLMDDDALRKSHDNDEADSGALRSNSRRHPGNEIDADDGRKKRLFGTVLSVV